MAEDGAEITQAKRGRPTCWTPEVEAKLYEALRVGVSRNKSAMYAGISGETFWKRMREDPEFSEKVCAEESRGIVGHAIKMASPEAFGNAASAVVNASKFFLATHDKEAFTEKREVEHSGSIDAVVRLFETDLGEKALDGDNDQTE